MKEGEEAEIYISDCMQDHRQTHLHHLQQELMQLRQFVAAVAWKPDKMDNMMILAMDRYDSEVHNRHHPEHIAFHAGAASHPMSEVENQYFQHYYHCGNQSRQRPISTEFRVDNYNQRDVYDLHHAILGLLFSVLVTAVITDAMKDAVGRPRPDFFWRCFPDGKNRKRLHVWRHRLEIYSVSKCIYVASFLFSQPLRISDQLAVSCAGLGFLSLYLFGKIRVFDCRGHVAKLCLVLLPLLLASLVAISRVDDYWHHWQDVFAGGLIGLVVAALCYLQFFPPPYHDQGIMGSWPMENVMIIALWKPMAERKLGNLCYCRVLEESRGTAQADNGENANANNTRIAEVQTESRPNERNDNGSMGISLSGDSGPTVEDLESGRR
ncbi:hypothetical protein RND71_011749 [Anisodus tanguticus]|uniref:Phosphatidic acid phosphatase type 2/haloperoxidase domain-containing protein n=1 Tax=Anisodus tanguticus TaxID=243964 RepID=A0AAE1VGC7_9SOLA|nr:hypothetical protein RND71_011749 [Anisodus tanguticus]